MATILVKGAKQMNDYIISTDSGSDLSESLYKEHNIVPIMMEYEIDGEVFQDTPDDKSIKEFYNKMREGAAPKTSQINSRRMAAFFEQFAKEGKNIMHIALSSGISGTCQSARIAAEEISEKYNVKITVIDSLAASLGNGMMCIMASDNRKNGMDFEKNCQFINDIRQKLNIYFTTNTLTYLHRGGRVSKTSAVLGHMLGINPILTVSKEGKLTVCDKVRGEKNTFANIRKKIASNVIDPQNQTLYISNSDCYERAKTVGEQIKEEFGFKDLVITNIGTIIGAHTGPELISIFYLGKPRVI